MDTIAGIDVSKDKLDIAVRPSGEIFSTSRDAAGLRKLEGLSRRTREPQMAYPALARVLSS